MKYILSIFTTVFILLNSSVSWGGVDGKGIFCKLNVEKDILYFSRNWSEELGFFFDNGKVTMNSICRSTDRYKKCTNYSKSISYQTNSKTIIWEDLLYDYTLNRENLSLIMKHFSLKGEPLYICEVFNDKNEYQKKFDLEIQKYQSEYDEKTKKNKI